MAVNPIGLVAAATAFLSIWLGHVSVRQMEARAVKLWVPMLVYTLLGLTMELGALFSTNRAVSTVLGIAGFSLLWDVLELKRQEKRVSRGHAPANPGNPRHVALLAGATSKELPPGLQKIGFPKGDASLGDVQPLEGRKQA